MRREDCGWDIRPLGSLSFLTCTILITHRDRRAITLVILNCTAEYIPLNPKGDFKA
jgi:hypothetical protein